MARADPARRDAPTQFYIAYPFYREGLGRVYSDDRLFKEGLNAVTRAIEVAPGQSVVVEDSTLGMRSSDELKAELERGLRREASDFNPMRVFGAPKMTPLREAVVLPVIFLTVALCGGFRAATTVKLVPPTLTSLVLAVPLLAPARSVGRHSRHDAPERPADSARERFRGGRAGGAVRRVSAGLESADSRYRPPACRLRDLRVLPTADDGCRDGQSSSHAPGPAGAVRIAVRAALHPGRGALCEGRRPDAARPHHADVGRQPRRDSYEPNAPVTGYMAFFTLVLYFVGLLLLPRPPVLALVRSQPSGSAALRSTLPVILLLCLAGAAACRKRPTAPRRGRPAARRPRQRPTHC